MSLAFEDQTVHTSLLEARLICGDGDIFKKFQKKFKKQKKSEQLYKFVDAKMAERDIRHRRLGDSRYVLEPDVKEGKGGLRDLHSLFWIVKNIYVINFIF